AQVLRRLLEALLGVGGDELHRPHPEEPAVGLRPERVLQVPVLEDGVGDGRGDPQELLLLVHALGDRHRVGAAVDAGEDVDLLDVEQPLRLVDRHVGLGLAVAVHLDDLVLAEHAALLDDVVDDHLGAAPAVEGAGRGKRPRVIVEGADLDRLLRLDRPGEGGTEDGSDQGRDHARTHHEKASLGAVRRPAWRGGAKVAPRYHRPAEASTKPGGARDVYRRASVAQSRPSKSAMVPSAPAAISSSAVWAVVTPTARMPARRAASTPTSESSKTRQ